MEAIRNVEGSRFPVLTPNLKVSIFWQRNIVINSSRICVEEIISYFAFFQGFEAAVASGAKEVAIFASASESFSKSNINCSIEDSLTRYSEVTLAAKKVSIPVRGYIFQLQLTNIFRRNFFFVALVLLVFKYQVSEGIKT